MSRKSLRLKQSNYFYLSNSIPKHVVYLGVEHEKIPDTHVNDLSLSAKSYKFDILFLEVYILEKE